MSEVEKAWMYLRKSKYNDIMDPEELKEGFPYLINVLYIIITADLSSRIDGAINVKLIRNIIKTLCVARERQTRFEDINDIFQQSV